MSATLRLAKMPQQLTAALVTPLADASDAPSRRFAPDAAAAERREHLDGPGLAMWASLKQAELRGVRERSSGPLSAETVARLRDLLQAVRDEPDADAAICFHGVCALLSEVDGRLADAVRHREMEIAKIQRLHETMRGKPADSVAFALQDYGAADLAIRRELLSSVRQALIDSGG